MNDEEYFYSFFRQYADLISTSYYSSNYETIYHLISREYDGDHPLFSILVQRNRRVTQFFSSTFKFGRTYHTLSRSIDPFDIFREAFSRIILLNGLLTFEDYLSLQLGNQYLE